MSTVTALPQGRPLTQHDLESVPDDGHRYELVDGTLIVSPAPSPRHQRAVAQLHLALATVCPPDLEVLFAPLDVAMAVDTVLQPDLLVARRADFTDENLPVPPLLAVEVLSPSTRLVDLNLKRARYEQAGCRSYWVVDPDEPSLTCWDLGVGGYVEAARAEGSQTVTVDRPFAVSLTPDHLVS